MSAYTAKFERTIGTAERSLTPALLHAVLTSLTLIQICGLRAIRRSVITYSAKYILLGLGGGITAALLMGKPSPIVVSNIIVPIYLSVFFIITFIPYIATLLTVAGPILYPILGFADALVRTFSLVRTIEVFEDTVSSTSSFGSTVTGFVSICFGGVLCELFFAEFGRPSKLKYYNLYVCAFAAIATSYINELADVALYLNVDIPFYSVDSPLTRSRQIIALTILAAGFASKKFALLLVDRPYKTKATTRTVRSTGSASKKRD